MTDQTDMTTRIMGWLTGAAIAGVLIVSAQMFHGDLFGPSPEDLMAVLTAADHDRDGYLTMEEMQAQADGAPQRVHRRAWQLVLGYHQLTHLSRWKRAEASALAEAIREQIQRAQSRAQDPTPSPP